MKTLTQGLILTVLFAISIFFGITYINTYMRTMPETESEQVDTTPINNNDELPPVTEPPEETFYSTLPRSPKELNLGEKINHIGGYDKESLCEYYIIGNYIYIIFLTDSDSCDCRAKATNIAVAKLSLDGTLHKVVTIQNDANVTYCASNYYDYGIMVVVTQENSTIIYTVDENLTHSKLILPYVFTESILIYSYPINVLITSMNNKLHAFGIDSSLSLVFNINYTFSHAINLIECYYIDSYHLFANINNCASVINFDSNGVNKITSISSTKMIDVMPTENGYILSTIENGTAKINWYSREFTKYMVTTLSEADNVVLAYINNGYLAITYGGIGEGKSYFICRHGDIISTNHTDLCNIKQVTNIESNNGFLIISALTYSTNNTAVIYRFDTNHYKAIPINTVSGVSTTKIFGKVINNKCYTIYTTTQTTSQHIDNWGNQDIFIRISDLY